MVEICRLSSCPKPMKWVQSSETGFGNIKTKWQPLHFHLQNLACQSIIWLTLIPEIYCKKDSEKYNLAYWGEHIKKPAYEANKRTCYGDSTIVEPGTIYSDYDDDNMWFLTWTIGYLWCFRSILQKPEIYTRCLFSNSLHSNTWENEYRWDIITLTNLCNYNILGIGLLQMGQFWGGLPFKHWNPFLFSFNEHLWQMHFTFSVILYWDEGTI